MYSSSTESLRITISHFDQMMEQNQQIQVDFLMLMKKNWLSEILVDNFPSSILMLSIWMLSTRPEPEHQTLKLFLNDTFKEFISVNYQIVVGVITSKSALGAVFSALTIRQRPCKILLIRLKSWHFQTHTHPKIFILQEFKEATRHTIIHWNADSTTGSAVPVCPKSWLDCYVSHCLPLGVPILHACRVCLDHPVQQNILQSILQ